MASNKIAKFKKKYQRAWRKSLKRLEKAVAVVLHIRCSENSKKILKKCPYKS